MKNEPGNQTKYYYRLASGEVIYQYCRSEAEAESWAETYSRQTLIMWGRHA
jgi:hypothetical protein